MIISVNLCVVLGDFVSFAKCCSTSQTVQKTDLQV